MNVRRRIGFEPVSAIDWSSDLRHEGSDPETGHGLLQANPHPTGCPADGKGSFEGRLFGKCDFNATPLQVAAMGGHLEVVNLLLAWGANVNHVDHDGFSPVSPPDCD